LKLALKLAAAVTLGIVIVFSVDGYLRVRRQLGTFEADMKRDHAAMGRALASAAASVWAAEGRERAEALIEQVNRKNAAIQIRFLPPTGSGGAQEAGKIASQLGEGQGGGFFLVTRVPLMMDGRLAGSLELQESFEAPRDFVRDTVIRVIMATLVTALVCSLIVLVMGYLLVGRPAARLVERARSIGRGDRTGSLNLRQKDEMGLLASEMDIMADRLGSADRRVARETAARMATVEQLRHADRLATVGLLALQAAHELGTPLNIISGRAAMISSGEAEGSEITSNAGIIAEQSERMAGMIRRILDFSRSRGTLRARVDPRALVRDAVALIEPLAAKKKVDLRMEEGGDVPAVTADETLIRQVLINLLVNGIQSMEGGGTLTTRLERGRRRPPDGSNERDVLCLRVRDEGCGIPDENFPRLFAPFFTTKPPGEGTGIGLAVSRDIVGEHGGWIEVESREGSGSCFSMYIPMEAGA
jgi:two-component system NtrC family sensor kinase